MIGLVENLLKRRRVQEVIVRINEYEFDDEDDSENEAIKQVVKTDLEEFDARIAALEQELQLLKKD